MKFKVRDRAQVLGTFRYIEVFLMETMARWVPTTPELEAKVLFGRHVWDAAQHADALGQRTFELRAQLQYSVAPTPEYLAFLEPLARVDSTGERIAALYEVLLPDLEARYREYLQATHPVMDEPSVRIIERILQDFARMRRESQEARGELPSLPPQEGTFIERLASASRAVQEIVAPIPLATTAPAVAAAGGAS